MMSIFCKTLLRFAFFHPEIAAASTDMIGLKENDFCALIGWETLHLPSCLANKPTPPVL